MGSGFGADGVTVISGFTVIDDTCEKVPNCGTVGFGVAVSCTGDSGAIAVSKMAHVLGATA